jgi:hypothetical protein
VGRAGKLLPISDHAKTTVSGGDVALGHTLDQRLRLAAEMNQVGDGADLQAVRFPEFDQVGQSGHGAIVFHDLA